MSEETHEDKKAVEVEGPTRPRRRRRRNRNPGDGGSEQSASSQETSGEVVQSAEAASAPAAPEASASPQPAGEDAPKSKARRRRRKSRSKRQGDQPAAEGGQDAAKTSGQQDGKKGDGTQQKSSSRAQNQNHQNRPKQSQPQPRTKQRPKSQSRANVYKPRTPESKFGGREPLISPDFEEERSNEPLALTPFELFCTYHLGISEDNRYRPSNIRDVAKRFAISQGELEQALKRCGLDRENMRKIGYDMSLAQLDMQVAPEGIDKRELAKVLFSELVEMSPEIERSVAAAEQAQTQAAQEQRVED